MNILLVNDDGITAPGLHALASAIMRRHNVTIVAPDRQRSGFSHSITLYDPIFIQHVEWSGATAYSISGTPADCVQLGLTEFSNGDIDIVLSGINNGANLGTDTHYSGTASAAMEGVFQGKRAIAASVAGKNAVNYNEFAEYILEFIDLVDEMDYPSGCFLNINAPNIRWQDIRGTRVAPLAMLNYTIDHEMCVNHRGARHCFARFMNNPENTVPHSDQHMIMQDYITVTPIHWDNTCYDAMAALKHIEKKL